MLYFELPFRDTDIKNAIKIANIYSARKLNNPSIIDCCIASYIEKYFDNLFLATLNHKHFPTYLFGRVYVWTIDAENDIFPIGIYKFNKEKARKVGL